MSDRVWMTLFLLSLIVLVATIASIDHRGADRKRRSVHYKTLPTVTNVQVNWQAKEQWI